MEQRALRIMWFFILPWEHLGRRTGESMYLFKRTECNWGLRFSLVD